MKSLRNKVIMSAIVLVFAVIATIGSTFAWFTVSNQTTVTSMNVEVASSESLLMRAWETGETEVEGQVYGDYGWELSDFTTNVDLLDSNAYSGVNLYTDWRMLPVTALVGETSFDTSYDNININNLRFLNGNDENPVDRPLALATANQDTGHFLEFKFWMLRPGEGDENITMDFILTTSGTDSYRNAIHIGVIGDKEEAVGTDIAFVDNDPALDTIESTLLDLSDYNAGDSIIVSGSDSNNVTYTVVSSTANAVTVAEDVVAEAAGNATLNGTNQELMGMDLDYSYEWQDFDAGFDDGALDSVVNLASITSGPLSNITGGDGTDNDEYVNHLETANVPELVTVRVWIEGWDLQTTNAIMGSQFNLAITFNLVA